MKTSDMVIGVGLIILGILFLFENFGYIAFDFADVWPVFVILAGVGFWIGYIQDKKNYGLVMPGTILENLPATILKLQTTAGHLPETTSETISENSREIILEKTARVYATVRVTWWSCRFLFSKIRRCIMAT